MLRRLHPDQPESFAFTPENDRWAKTQVTKYPEGRQASAIIPLLWRAQEQEGWLTRPAIEAVADMLGMAHIRALEVATFYFMFQLAPVGSVAHIQVCGTTSCMICGAEDLISVCREKIADKPHTLSADGKFSWEEVECLGACTNAPMAQIGKDYYEDLTTARLGEIIDALSAGDVPQPGPQNGRFGAEPKGGLVVLTEGANGPHAHNASVTHALDLGETVKRIDGTEEPLRAPWLGQGERAHLTGLGADAGGVPETKAGAVPAEVAAASETAASETPDPTEAGAAVKAAQPAGAPSGDAADTPGTKPEMLAEAREGGPDNLKEIKGIGPALEKLCHELGVFHFDQIATWGAAEVAWMDDNLTGFKGRVSRDDWVGQAKTLAAGGETEFSSRVDKGEVY